MKRLATTLGMVALVAMVATPVFAYRGGWGGPSRGPGSCWQGYYGGSNLTEDQRAELDKVEQAFYSETSKLRDEIWAKSDELDAVLDESVPDGKKAKALQKEISDLRAKMAEKRIDFELKAKKIAPDADFRRGKGPGYGRGYYSRHMRGGGPRGGYGPGPCWE